MPFKHSTLVCLTLAYCLFTARVQHKAVAAFNIYNFEGAKAVLQAASLCGAPVILQAHPGSLSYGGEELLKMLIALRDSASVPVSVHLDHATDEQQIHMALRAGVDSIMVDGSAMPFEQNMEWTAKMAALAHAQVWQVQPRNECFLTHCRVLRWRLN